MLELKVLGYPEVVLDGKTIEGFISNKVVVLLCYLAMNPRTHARERLAGLFWGDMPDQKAKSNLRQALHDLGKRVGGYIEVTRQTARFRHDQHHTIDAVVLKSVSEDENRTVETVENTIKAYRGAFLEGINLDTEGEIEDWLWTQREQLRLIYIDLLERLGGFYIRQSDWAQAESTLRKLLSVEPLREATHRQLMMAYARQGKYDLALAQYESCVEVLDEELGVEPMAETSRLWDAIQNARALPRHNLPTTAKVFVGRDKELEELGSWLGDPSIQLINILGPGGTGKSHLATQLASLHVHRFLHGVRYLALTALTQSAQIVPALAQILDITLNPSPNPINQLLAYFENKEMLLVLDNAEHIPDISEQLDAILSHAPDIKIILTSRVRFHLQQEHIFSLEGLRLPDEAITDGDALQSYASIQLYLQNAQQHVRKFSLTGHEWAISRFCRLVGGMPLAIEIATALLPVMSVEQLTRGIEEDLDLLDTPLQNVPERHRSLRAVFDRSWGLLTPEEQTVLARLSVFRGTFSLDAAKNIASITLPILQKLVSQSLVYAYPHKDHESRYDIHITIGQYAFRMLEKDPVLLQAVLTHHIDYYTRLLEANDRILLKRKNRAATLAESLQLTEAELSNIRMTWQYAVEQRSFDAIYRMSAPLHRFYEGTSRFQEGSDLFEYALTTLRDDDFSPEEALAFHKASIHCAGLHLRLGHVERVLALSEEGLAIFEAQDQITDLGFALNILGIAQIYTGQFTAAQTSLLKCAEAYRQTNNDAELLKPLANLGSLSIRIGDHETAEAVLKEGIAIAEQVDDQRGLSHFLANLGAVYQSTGQFDKAMHYYERVLLLSDAMSNLHVKAVTLMNIGEMQIKLGNFQQAVARLTESNAITQQINDHRNHAAGLTWMGLAYSGASDQKQAVRSLYQGLETARQTDAGPVILQVLIGIGKYFIDQGRRERGIALLDYAIHHEATEHGSRGYARQILEAEAIDPDEPIGAITGALDAVVIECLSELRSLDEDISAK